MREGTGPLAGHWVVLVAKYAPVCDCRIEMPCNANGERCDPQGRVTRGVLDPVPANRFLICLGVGSSQPKVGRLRPPRCLWNALRHSLRPRSYQETSGDIRGQFHATSSFEVRLRSPEDRFLICPVDAEAGSPTVRNRIN